MSGEKLSDADPKKSYSLHADIDIVNLSKDEEGNPEVELINGPISITVKPIGNIYCLGDQGFQIAMFAVVDDELFYDEDNIGIS
jgi:hypothetical protein